MNSVLSTSAPVRGDVGRHLAITFENVSIAFEGNQVLDDVSFVLQRGETKEFYHRYNIGEWTQGADARGKESLSRRRWNCRPGRWPGQ